MKIKVKVQPNSGRQEIRPMSEKEYKIFLKKAATENKENMELIKILTKHFQKKTEIIKGHNLKNKTIEVKQSQ